MKFILKISNSGEFGYITVRGSEPLRNYKRTRSLIETRLKDSYPGFADILAVPNILSDGCIEWSTNAFSTLPRPLGALSGEERKHYGKILTQTVAKLKSAIAAVSSAADVAELEAITTVPSQDVVFCADNRVVIAEWGLRPLSGGRGISLLCFTNEDKEDEVAPVVAVPLVAAEEKTEQKAPETKPEDKPIAPPVVTTHHVNDKEETKETVPPVVPPIVPPVEPPVDVVAPENGRKKRSKWWLWLLLLLLIIAAVLIAMSLFNSCSTQESVETLPQRPPVISEQDIVLKDSISYVASDRLTIFVLEGGTMNEFIKDFRKQYPDTDKYKLFAPDTTFNTIQLQLPEQELDNAKKEIPGKMAPDYRVSVIYDGILKQQYTPSDPAMSIKAQSYYFDMVNAPEAWDIQKGDPNLIVAILDDGFDTAHPELLGKVYDAYDVSAGRAGTTASSSGHGQHTSGTAVGTADNNSGACGIAPGCKAMPINVFNGNTASCYDIIMGLAYAAKHGAKVISISIGQYFGPTVKFLSYADQKAIAQSYMTEEAAAFDEIYRQLDEMGITVVRAAGNETVLAELDPMNRSQYPIIVSAVGPDGSIAVFNPQTLDGSNWGERCDVSAPGIDIYNSIPGGYDFMSGTSMACPQVAGGAALLYSQHPDLKPQQVKEILVKTGVSTDEHVGPLMDLAAALNADPDNLPESPQARTQPGRGNPTDPAGTDPFAFYYYNNPTPGINPNPSIPGMNPTPGNPGDCEQALQELRELQRRYEEIVARYGACL